MSFDTSWMGTSADKFFLQSGQFSSTVKTSSADWSAIIGDADGHGFDGTDSYSCANTGDKLFRLSGQYTITVKDSQVVSAFSTTPTGISFDGTNTVWISSGFSHMRKLWLQSGQFSATLKTSYDVNPIETIPESCTSNLVSSSGNDTPWTGVSGMKLYLQSGQFSSTMKTSLLISGVNITPSGIAFDGTNTIWSGQENNETLYLQSGQFSATLKTSLDISGIDNNVRGVAFSESAAAVFTPTAVIF
jgi:hypothetical protein